MLPYMSPANIWNKLMESASHACYAGYTGHAGHAGYADFAGYASYSGYAGYVGCHRRESIGAGGGLVLLPIVVVKPPHPVNLATRSGVQGAECREQSAGCRVQGAVCRVQNAGSRVEGNECRVQGWM